MTSFPKRPSCVCLTIYWCLCKFCFILFGIILTSFVRSVFVGFFQPTRFEELGHLGLVREALWVIIKYRFFYFWRIGYTHLINTFGRSRFRFQIFFEKKFTGQVPVRLRPDLTTVMFIEFKNVLIRKLFEFKCIFYTILVNNHLLRTDCDRLLTSPD